MRIDGYHLPGVPAPDADERSYPLGEAEPLVLRMPRHTPEELGAQIDRLLAARAALDDRPVAEIIAAIERVALRFLDENDPLRHAALAGMHAISGHSIPMARAILDGMAGDWWAAPLERMVEAEFGDAGVLDGFAFRPDGIGQTRAFGPELAVHVFSGNVPGVSVTSLIRTLLVKAAALGKTAAEEPVLAPLFASALAAEDPEIGACLAVTHWAGGDEALEEVALARASAVLAYGGVETIRSLRERTPRETPFLGYSHRVSFGVVAREALTPRDAAAQAADAALAVAMFDQRGCVSPHLFYVEKGGEVSPAGWAGLLAESLARLQGSLPRGAIAPEENAAIQQLRGQAEFARLAGEGHELHVSNSGTDWTVIHDPDPAFSPSCLNRVVNVKPVDSIDEVAGLAAPVAAVIQSVGFAGPEYRKVAIAKQLGALGASRITSFAKMPWPPTTWHHDGRPPLGDLVRWCDIE